MKNKKNTCCKFQSSSNNLFHIRLNTIGIELKICQSEYIIFTCLFIYSVTISLTTQKIKKFLNRFYKIDIRIRNDDEIDI